VSPCRLKTDPTNPLEAVESYQEGADLLSQARWVAQPTPMVARNFQLYSAPSSHAGRHGQSRLAYPTLVAGHGNDGAQRPKDREDAEHARHGASLGFRSHNWQLRLSAALACRGYVPGVRAVAAAVLRSATCRSHHLPTRRSKSVCDSSCAKSWASRSATRKTQRPCRHHRHQLASKRGPTAAERPAGDTGPAAAERPGAEPGAERPGRYGARPLRGPAATERPGRYGEARPVRRDPEDLSTSAARVIHHPGCGWHGERR